jgi:hypothetical protein
MMRTSSSTITRWRRRNINRPCGPVVVNINRPCGPVVVGGDRVSLIISPCLAWEEEATLKGRATIISPCLAWEEEATLKGRATLFLMD